MGDGLARIKGSPLDQFMFHSHLGRLGLVLMNAYGAFTYTRFYIPSTAAAGNGTAMGLSGR